MKFTLNKDEVDELLRQEPDTASHGGFQHLLVKLQKQLNPNTNEIYLDDDDLEKIPRYAYDYRSGGWQNRLELIFGRTLGSKLGRDMP